MITQKPGLVMAGAVIFMVVLVAGCLGSTVQKPLVPCSAKLVPGQNMTINETQDSATICAQPGSSLTLELSDSSPAGNRWIINASPGLQISEEGMTWYWYAMNGTFLSTSNVPFSGGPGGDWGHGVDRWNVTMTQTGVQTINATLQHYIVSPPDILETHNWTIVVS
jgi:predicted secreted protein